MTKASLGAMVALCLLVLGAAFIGMFNQAEATGPIASNEHLVTIHDRGSDRSVITKQATLRAALKETGIVLDTNDIVEPGLDEKLVSKSYQVNIYRARPVTIIDGASMVRVMSAYQTPKQIAKQANIELRDEDTETLSLPSNLITDGSSLVLTIHRATAFTLVLYGKPVTSYSQAKTVGDMLKQKGIKLAKDDTVSVSQTSALTAGMTVEVWREGVQTVTVEEPIAFETKQIQDVNQPVGYKQVQTQGQNGKKMVTYQITIKNGVEAGRQAIQTVVTEQPIQQVEVVGVKVNLPPGSHTDWMAAAGISSEDYGYADYIIGRESGWNPYAVNRSSGACGLPQAYPCSKLGSGWNDPIVGLTWANNYVGRYGGWAGAYAHWQKYNSY